MMTLQNPLLLVLLVPWAALLFGATSALQFLFQAAGTTIPYQAMLALPYVLALAVLATAVGRVEAPEGLTKN